MTEDTLGVWCRGKLPDGTPCRSVEVVVVETSNRHEGIRRLRRCPRCGARQITLERFELTTEKHTIRSRYPVEQRPLPKD